MATAQEIVTRAFKRLNIIRPNANPSATQAQYGLDALNEMIDSWAAFGVDVTLDIPLAVRHERGIVALLAVRLSGDYGIDPKPSIVIDAKNGWTGIQAAYIVAPVADFDAALKVLPSNSISGVDIINNV